MELEEDKSDTSGFDCNSRVTLFLLNQTNLWHVSPKWMGNLVSVILRPCETYMNWKDHKTTAGHYLTPPCWYESQPKCFSAMSVHRIFPQVKCLCDRAQLPESLCNSPRFCHLPMALAGQTSILPQVGKYVLCCCPSLSPSRTLDSLVTVPLPTRKELERGKWESPRFDPRTEDKESQLSGW